MFTMIVSGSYCTMRRPVSQPLVSSWKKTMIAYADHQVRVAVSRVGRRLKRAELGDVHRHASGDRQQQ